MVKQLIKLQFVSLNRLYWQSEFKQQSSQSALLMLHSNACEQRQRFDEIPTTDHNYPH